MTGDLIGRSLELLRDGLRRFLEQEIELAVRQNRLAPSYLKTIQEQRGAGGDVAVLLRLLRVDWLNLARNVDRRARTLAFECAEIRNAWAHQTPFTREDTRRALDTIARLLRAIGAPEADEVARLQERSGPLAAKEQASPQRADDCARPAQRSAGNLRAGGAARRDLPNMAAFREEIQRRFAEASREGQQFLTLNSGEIHRDLGGGSGKDGRLAPCCNAMHEVMKGHDMILESPPKGRGSRLTIRYKIPR